MASLLGLENLDKLVRDGWTVTITTDVLFGRNPPKVHASVHLHPRERHGRLSYHYVGKDVVEAVTGLEFYLSNVVPK